MSNIKGIVSTPDGQIDKWQVIGAVGLVFVLAVSLLLGYWVLIDDNPPAKIDEIYMYASEDSDVPVDEVFVRPGDTIYFAVDWCKNTTASARTRYTWINALIHIEPIGYPASFPIGCEYTRATVAVPDTLPSSNHPYTLLGTVEYKVNPLMTRDVNFSVGDIYVIGE